MKFNIKHKILKQLSEKFFANFDLHISYKALTVEQIAEQIGYTVPDTYRLISPLLALDEIKYCDISGTQRGLFIATKGVAALTDEKYVNQMWDRIINITTRIIIPVLSLSVAIIGLSLAHARQTSSDTLESINKEVKELRGEIESIRSTQLQAVPVIQIDTVKQK